MADHANVVFAIVFIWSVMLLNHDGDAHQYLTLFDHVSVSDRNHDLIHALIDVTRAYAAFDEFTKLNAYDGNDLFHGCVNFGFQWTLHGYDGGDYAIDAFQLNPQHDDDLTSPENVYLLIDCRFHYFSNHFCSLLDFLHSH